MESLFEKQAREMMEKYNQQKKPASEPTSLLALLVGVVGAGLLVALASAYGVFVHGFIGHLFWQWFIVPIFHFQPLTILQASGIMFLVRLFTYENPLGLSDSLKGADRNTIANKILATLLMPWISLLIGYIIHCIM